MNALCNHGKVVALIPSSEWADVILEALDHAGYDGFTVNPVPVSVKAEGLGWYPDGAFRLDSKMYLKAVLSGHREGEGLPLPLDIDADVLSIVPEKKLRAKVVVRYQGKLYRVLANGDVYLANGDVYPNGILAPKAKKDADFLPAVQIAAAAALMESGYPGPVTYFWHQEDPWHTPPEGYEYPKDMRLVDNWGIPL